MLNSKVETLPPPCSKCWIPNRMQPLEISTWKLGTGSFGEREMDGLYMLYMFFLFSAIHVAEYANELLFFLGEGIVEEAETYKIEASQDCTCFLFGLAAETGTVFPST